MCQLRVTEVSDLDINEAERNALRLAGQVLEEEEDHPEDGPFVDSDDDDDFSVYSDDPYDSDDDDDDDWPWGQRNLVQPPSPPPAQPQLPRLRDNRQYRNLMDVMDELDRALNGDVGPRPEAEAPAATPAQPPAPSAADK